VAAREGARVLVVDLDPQGAATFYFRVNPQVKAAARAWCPASATSTT